MLGVNPLVAPVVFGMPLGILSKERPSPQNFTPSPTYLRTSLLSNVNEYVPQLLTATAEIVALSVTVRRWPQAARLAADTHRHARPLRAHRRTWPRECGRPPLCLLCTQRSTPPTCVDSAQRQSEGPALLGGAVG